MPGRGRGRGRGRGQGCTAVFSGAAKGPHLDTPRDSCVRCSAECFILFSRPRPRLKRPAGAPATKQFTVFTTRLPRYREVEGHPASWPQQGGPNHPLRHRGGTASARGNASHAAGFLTAGRRGIRVWFRKHAALPVDFPGKLSSSGFPPSLTTSHVGLALRSLIAC